MQRKIRDLSKTDWGISLHDCRIIGVESLADGVEFYFDRLWDGAKEIPNARVIVHGVDAEDIICEVVRLVRFAHRFRRICTPYEFEEIAGCIDRAHPLELDEEFYSYNQIFWELSKLPYQGRGKTPRVTMKMSSMKSISVEYFIDAETEGNIS